MRFAGLTLAAAILLTHVLVFALTAGRPLDHDENEAMHASWLSAAGKRIYRDFFEEHPPQYPAMLRAVMPDGALRAIDVRAWAINARALSAMFGLATLLALMAYVWRMTRSFATLAVAATALMTSDLVWSTALGDIRNDVPTLALMWIGIVMLVWEREPSRAQSIRGGAGIGLMFAAALMNPKWPLECVVMGVVYLDYLRRARGVRLHALLAAATVASIAVVPVAAEAALADYVFFVYRFKALTLPAFESARWVSEYFAQNPNHHAILARMWIVSFAIACIAFLPMPASVDKRLVRIALALLAASMLEIRFLYTYPYLWTQYVLMLRAAAGLLLSLLPLVRIRWSRTAVNVIAIQAALTLLVYAWLSASGIAFVIACVVALVPLVRRDIALTFASIAIVAVLGRLSFTPPVKSNDYWARQRALQTSLREGETVWILPPRHPVAAFDASYYWFSFNESVPTAVLLRERYPRFLPPIAFSDLPVCTLPPSLRYLDLAHVTELEGACHCVERAWNDGMLAPTPYIALFELHAGPRQSPMWLRRTRDLWPHLCAAGVHGPSRLDAANE